MRLRRPVKPKAPEQPDVIHVPIARRVVESLDEWSEPIQMRFEHHENTGWLVWFRTTREAHEQSVADRAARQ